MKLKVNNIGLEDTENGGRNGRIRLIRVDRALCNICCNILAKLICTTLRYKLDFTSLKLYFASHFAMRYRLPTTLLVNDSK